MTHSNKYSKYKQTMFGAINCKRSALIFILRNSVAEDIKSSAFAFIRIIIRESRTIHHRLKKLEKMT